MADSQPTTQTPQGKKKLKSSTVKDAISQKGKTITGDKPDQININPMQEEKERHAVFAFGRFNPPTTGHEKLIHAVEKKAKEVGGEAHIVASHSEGTSKNPVSSEKKVGYLKKVASDTTHVSSSSKEHPSLLHHLTKLHNAGVKHLTMVAGSDRVNEYKDTINKYNGVENKHGQYNFKSINVVSAGHRDPDAEGAEGMSGTKMRSLAREGNHSEFKKGLPKALHPHAKEIMNHIRSVKEDVMDIDQAFDFFMFAESVNSAGSGAIRGMGNVTGSVTGNQGVMTTYAINNSVEADTKDNILKALKKTVHDALHVTKESVNDENPDPKHREAVSRSGQDPKLKQLVPRNKVDRKNDDRPYRHQEIVKKILDEKYGKGYVSPASKIEKAMKQRGVDINSDKHKQENDRLNKEYQAILDKEKKEVKEDTTTSDIPVWEKPGPKGKSKKMTPGQVLRAKARAKKAGRPYPNLVDNMAVSKE